MRWFRIKQIFLWLISLVGVIILPISTFIFGLAITLLWYEIVSPPNVTLCQLAQAPSFYAWRTVRVESDAFSYGAVFLVDSTCQGPASAGTGVWRADGYEPSEEVQKLFTDSDSENYRARIVVTGRFYPDATSGCYVPKSAIEATNIELKSAISSETVERENREN